MIKYTNIHRHIHGLSSLVRSFTFEIKKKCKFTYFPSMPLWLPSPFLPIPFSILFLLLLLLTSHCSSSSCSCSSCSCSCSCSSSSSSSISSPASSSPPSPSSPPSASYSPSSSPWPSCNRIFFKSMYVVMYSLYEVSVYHWCSPRWSEKRPCPSKCT